MNARWYFSRCQGQTLSLRTDTPEEIQPLCTAFQALSSAPPHGPVVFRWRGSEGFEELHLKQAEEQVEPTIHREAGGMLCWQGNRAYWRKAALLAAALQNAKTPSREYLLNTREGECVKLSFGE